MLRGYKVKLFFLFFTGIVTSTHTSHALTCEIFQPLKPYSPIGQIHFDELIDVTSIDLSDINAGFAFYTHSGVTYSLIKDESRRIKFILSTESHLKKSPSNINIIAMLTLEPGTPEFSYIDKTRMLKFNCIL